MKLLSLAATAAIFAQSVSAHYWFDVTVYNGQASGAWQYIRKPNRTLYNPTKLSTNPAGDILDNAIIDVGPDSRCNKNAAVANAVLTVTAGTQLTARLAPNEDFEHPGPSYVYMSRAPSDNVKAYDGSGDWFKIFQEGVCNSGGDFTNNAWCAWRKTTLTATIPKDTPNGEYLVRFEHIGIHRSHVNQPEHYMSCVQVKVTGGGTGNPGPLVKFPGVYKPSDAYANFSVYNGHKAVPWSGPAVWTGGGSSSSTAGPQPTQGPETPGNCAALYGQCGGSGWAGAKCCSQGTCKATNEWYSQCL
ncbi:glycosyl hydrolase family 61-domain-containing protein [Pterulicium gracile]|uniref:AA9 family lytic polysaccharide monooxygenase n=1 Tax=Pterulicium gracile TaxID=1884261 RepID=A0A5C3Q7J7_9AGAR|nr:glycosyl hydrolase family 61-domain-containing protein [Pterula gracilis]